MRFCYCANGGAKFCRAEVELVRTACAIFLAALLMGGASPVVPAQERAGGRKDIYHDGWIDLNKNGREDIYEDPKADVGARVEDLLSQMTLEQQTCQIGRAS